MCTLCSQLLLEFESCKKKLVCKTLMSIFCLDSEKYFREHRLLMFKTAVVKFCSMFCIEWLEGNCSFFRSNPAVGLFRNLQYFQNQSVFLLFGEFKKNFEKNLITIVISKLFHAT